MDMPEATPATQGVGICTESAVARTKGGRVVCGWGGVHGEGGTGAKVTLLLCHVLSGLWTFSTIFQGKLRGIPHRFISEQTAQLLHERKP